MKWIPFLLFFPSLGFAQFSGGGFDRVQLSDVNIQGEANSDGMRFSQRNMHDINGKLNIRTNFLDRVRELVPPDWQKPPPQATP